MLTCIDCLEISESVFCTAEAKGLGTVWVPDDLFDVEKDLYELESHSSWEVKICWAYRWNESGQEEFTENPWYGGYETAQAAFEAAYEMYGPCGDLEKMQPWKEYASVWNEHESAYILDASFIGVNK